MPHGVGRGRQPATMDLRLARQLKQLRQAAEMSGADAAQKTGWSPSKISRVELMRTGVSPSDVAMLCDIYGADDDTRALLVGLAEQGEHVSGRDRGPMGGLAVYRDEAASALIWAPVVIPPPLRIPEYGRALARAAAEITLDLPSEAHQAGAVAREWQRRIEARRNPLRISAVIDGSALRRLVGSADIMLRQMDHLAWLLSLDHVDVKVLMLDTPQAPAGVGGFTLLSFDAGAEILLSDVAVFDDTAAPWLAEDEPVTYRCRRAFGRLGAAGRDPLPAVNAARAHWRPGDAG
jgi:transcriptional regulator with XRE-family HTH domain